MVVRYRLRMAPLTRILRSVLLGFLGIMFLPAVFTAGVDTQWRVLSIVGLVSSVYGLRIVLGPAVEVDTHIEPLQPPEAAGREAPPERVRAVEMALAEIAAESGMIRDVHNVRVRETDEGEIVNFHGRADPALAVQAVHEKIDEVERALRRRSPSIKRVIGHAEPRR